MPQQGTSGEPPERRYDEAMEPQNPPNSVVNPEVRKTAVWTYLGIIVAVFAVVGVALLYWTATDQRVTPEGERSERDPSAIGTSGERMPRENTPGGFNPDRTPGDTRSELEFRGAGEPRQGPTPGLDAQALTRLGAMREGTPQSLEGRRIDLTNVLVERADGGAFWVRDGDATSAVIAPGGSPTVRAGQRVNLSGSLEQDGGQLRIRATRIEVK
jgi:hypothetical protein